MDRTAGTSHPLKPLPEIAVPPPRPDEIYEFELFGRLFRFQGLKKLLGAADIDENANDASARSIAPTTLDR